MKPELTTEQLAQPIAVTLPLGVLLGLSNDKPAILVPGAPTRLDKLRQKARPSARKDSTASTPVPRAAITASRTGSSRPSMRRPSPCPGKRRRPGPSRSAAACRPARSRRCSSPTCQSCSSRKPTGLASPPPASSPPPGIRTSTAATSTPPQGQQAPRPGRPQIAFAH